MITQAQGDGWMCTTSGATAQCQRSSLAATMSAKLSVTALPPLSATAALATVQVSASSVDPNLSNNIAQASIDITEPLYPRGLGGGLSCQLGRGPGSKVGPDPAPWGVLLGLPLFWLGLQRRLRRTFRSEHGQ